MPMAFVMINSELGSEKELIREMKSIDGVVEAYEVYGVHDILIKVSAPSMDQLKGVISKRIRSIKGARSTLTMVVIE